MFYFPVPAPRKLASFLDAKTNEPLVYTFASFLEEYVFNVPDGRGGTVANPAWRENVDSMESFLRITGELAGKKAGAVVELLDGDWEKLYAQARTAPITGPLHTDAMHFVLAIATARKTKPEPVAAPAAAAPEAAAAQ